MVTYPFSGVRGTPLAGVPGPMTGFEPPEVPPYGGSQGVGSHPGLHPPGVGGNVRRVRRRKRRTLDWFRSGSRFRRRADASETKGGGEVVRGLWGTRYMPLPGGKI